ncbi:MAG: HIRAN domain-containing protein [Clostridia bacterium]|nr:HIRAN domain-containing protein [Clostridia bacterium]
MKKIWFTIAGTRYQHGKEFLEPGMEVRLVKEPDNEFDSEAILVKIDGLGTIGHVANSVRTRIGESSSAGRIYDKFDTTARGIIRFNVDGGVVCELVLGENETDEDCGELEEPRKTGILLPDEPPMKDCGPEEVVFF